MIRTFNQFIKEDIDWQKNYDIAVRYIQNYSGSILPEIFSSLKEYQDEFYKIIEKVRVDALFEKTDKKILANRAKKAYEDYVDKVEHKLMKVLKVHTDEYINVLNTLSSTEKKIVR